MKQLSLTHTGFERKPQRARKREFLDEVNLVLPWADWVVLITPRTPELGAKGGRTPPGIETITKGSYMHADFFDALQRHWVDAEHLLQAQRLANADHLYGMAAECGLKRLMLAFGMPYDTARGQPVQQSDRVHANGIWDRFESYRSGHALGAGYSLPPGNPFANWNVTDRYAHQDNFNQTHVQGHQTGAKMVRTLIAKAQLEGLL